MRHPYPRVLARASVVFVVVGVMLCFAAPALAATTFSGATPTAVGAATSLSNVALQVSAQDPAQLKPSATLVLDGIAKTPSFGYAGHWEYDEWDEWWVSDPTQATVRYVVPKIAVGSHDVTVTVTNNSNVSTSYHWSFQVAAGQTSFGLPTPAAGAFVPDWDVPVGIQANDPVRLADGPVLAIDGVPHTLTMLYGAGRIPYATWEAWSYEGEVAPLDMTQGYVEYTPSALSDGPHTASVTVTNSTGRAASYSWSFVTAAPPRISSMTPGSGSSVSTQKPVVSAKVVDNGALASTEMWVDAAAVDAAFDAATGVLSYTPASPLANDRKHTVKVVAKDAGGLARTAEWEFTVQIYADMPTPGTCTDCHDVAQHPMSNCASCHEVVREIGHGLTPAPAWRCTQCHHVYSHGPAQITPGVTWGGGDEPQEGYTGYWGLYCDWCHSSRYPSIPQHSKDNAVAHNTDKDIASCQSCHVTSLTREHFRYKDDAGNAYDCWTCHGAGAEQRVKDAVAAGNSSCEACHTMGTSGDAHEALHTPAGLDPKCTGCHRDSLTQEHMANTGTQSAALGCDACHSSGRVDVVWAVFSGDKSCDACHVSAHSMGFSPVPSGVPLYPGYRWSQPLDSTLFTGEPWLPAGFGQAGRLLISDRSTGASAGEVWSFYDAGLTSNGWSTSSQAPASGSTSFSATWAKGTHRMVVLFFGSVSPEGGEAVPTGNRIEVLYK